MKQCNQQADPDTATANSSGDELAWQIFVTVLCIVASLVGGWLYAWAAYSEDLQRHFSWSLAEATTVQASAVFGSSVLVLLIGIIMKAAGPAVTTVNCLVLLSGSFFGLYWLALERNPSVVLACVLYAINSLGSIGFFIVAIYTISTTWPGHLVGVSICVVDIALTLGSSVVASIYPMFNSIAQFYYVLAWVALIVGLLMFSVHVKWSLLATWYQSKQEATLPKAEVAAASSSEEGQGPSLPPYSSPHSLTKDISIKRAMTSYNTMEKPDRASLKLQRKATFLSDDVIAGRTHKEDFFVILGITPSLEELRVKYPNLSTAAAVLTLEFGIVSAFMFCCFSSSTMMIMQLAALQDLTRTRSWELADLLWTVNVARTVGKVVGGIMSDATAHAKIITKELIMACAIVLILCTYAFLSFGKYAGSGLAGVLLFNGIAVGIAAVTLKAMLKCCFGARMMSLLLSLSYCFFWAGFSFWGFIFVQVHSHDGSLKLLNMWLVVSLACLIPLALALWTWLSELALAAHAR